jgi:hypothetical protein
MTHADEGLSAVEAERLRIDLRLIPQLEPTGRGRLGDIDRRARPLVVGQQRRHAIAQALVTERREQRGKYPQAEFVSGVPDGRQRRQVLRPEQQNVALKLCSGK